MIFFGFGASLLILNFTKSKKHVKKNKNDKNDKHSLTEKNKEKHQKIANTYPLILITNATFGAPSTKKFPAALASLLDLRRASSAA
jgi:Na+/H+ antiporter NhaC